MANASDFLSLNHVPTRYRRAEGRYFAGGPMLLRGGQDHYPTYQVGKKFARVWILIDGKRTLGEIHQLIKDDVSAEALQSIMRDFKKMKVAR